MLSVLPRFFGSQCIYDINDYTYLLNYYHDRQAAIKRLTVTLWFICHNYCQAIACKFSTIIVAATKIIVLSPSRRCIYDCKLTERCYELTYT